MSIQFHCPECQELVRVSATLAGLHTRCPSCAVSVPVPDASEAVTAGARAHPHEAATRREWESSPLPEPLTVAECAPSPLGARRPDPGWKMVHVGLTLELAGTIVALIAFGLASLLQCGQLGLDAAEAPGTSGVALAFSMVGVVIVVACLVGFVLVLVGRGLTCTVPSSTHARGLALGSVVSLGSAALLGLMFLLALTLRGGSEAVAFALLALAVLTGLAALVAQILFCFFLRGVAVYLGNAPLGTWVVVFLVTLLVLLLVLVTALVLLGMVTARPGFPNSRAMVGLLIIGQLVQVAIVLPLLAWHCSLVAQTRATVAER